MFQTQFANHLSGRLGGDAANLMEEGYTTHAHSTGHLVETDLSTTHVLQDELFDIAHELLVHKTAHGIVANGVVVVIACQYVDLLLSRGFLNLRLDFRFGSLCALSALFTLIDAFILDVLIANRRGGHTSILTFEHTCLLTLDDVLVDLDRSKT